ncbi:GNAT family N-acetyltransferase [Microbacterium sp. cx-59]|uniref:GNAT family N-acetyltransferase n=1 Tax=Microbacterium sp. cx-59 TaxID=2891207 RepID=UPI001E5035D3|nr:GNAT family N-acetyltransferase [Microbacterium sp. cx-59]MCC4907076.1 N-acetyltransferase family protein [Microbacterium sp. cx-59]
MNHEGTTRTAQPSDAAACAAIYAHYVENTAITFETEAPTETEMARRIAQAQDRHAWLVWEIDGSVVGYAYAGPFKARAAYRWSCEVSVYLRPDHRGAGGGRALYDGLLRDLRARGYRRAVAAITQPNPASMRLHERYGFEGAGLHRRIGWKHRAWHDVAWAELDLMPGADLRTPPAELS